MVSVNFYFIFASIILYSEIHDAVKKAAVLINVFDTIKKYICDEINSKYIATLFKSNGDVLHLEQRDEKMSRHIHTLLSHSKHNRYFFAIGAGISYRIDLFFYFVFSLSSYAW